MKKKKRNEKKRTYKSELIYFSQRFLWVSMKHQEEWSGFGHSMVWHGWFVWEFLTVYTTAHCTET